MAQNKNTASTKISAPISKIIKQLMAECNIIEAELARQTGLPQTTINRLLLGDTCDPRATTLIPIAKFFSITIGQLVGEEALNPSRVRGTYNSMNRAAWSIIPLINWHDAKSWLFQKGKYNPSNHNEWITTENENSLDAFALKTLESMEPRFKKNSTIIVDPQFIYTDGSYIVISLNNGDATVRRILIDGSDVFLKKIYGDKDIVRLKDEDHIIGTITETRISEK